MAALVTLRFVDIVLQEVEMPLSELRLHFYIFFIQFYGYRYYQKTIKWFWFYCS